MALRDLLGSDPQRVLIARKAPESGFVMVDVSLSEDHVREAELTDSPVETGSDVTDHRRIRPAQLSIRGLVTDTPASMLASIAAGPTPFSSLSKDAYEKLRAQFEAHELVTVVTSLRVYDNMAWTSFRVHKSPETGKALEFDAALREVRFAVTATVPFRAERPTSDMAAPKTNLGTKAGISGPPEPPSSIAGKTLLMR
jgi:hypothetical protein